MWKNSQELGMTNFIWYRCLKANHQHDWKQVQSILELVQFACTSNRLNKLRRFLPKRKRKWNKKLYWKLIKRTWHFWTTDEYINDASRSVSASTRILFTHDIRQSFSLSLAISILSCRLSYPIIILLLFVFGVSTQTKTGGYRYWSWSMLSQKSNNCATLV